MSTKSNTSVVFAVNKLHEELQTLSVDALSVVAKGFVDINKMVGAELANRGLDKDGEWVGFPKANEIHGIVKKS